MSRSSLGFPLGTPAQFRVPLECKSVTIRERFTLSGWHVSSGIILQSMATLCDLPDNRYEKGIYQAFSCQPLHSICWFVSSQVGD